MLNHWKDHFHPHEGNDHQPHAYRAAGAIALGLVVLSIVSFTSLQSYYITHSEHFLSAVLPAVLVDLTNEDRAKEGLRGLEPNETLKTAAQMKADHMAELGYFAHDAPDGTTPWEWFARAGYEYELAGENLAINFSDSADVSRAWMDSPLHRDNILEEGFTEIGIATARGEYKGDDTVFVVQMFARPTSGNLAQRDGGGMTAVQGDSTADPVAGETAATEPDTVTAQPDPEPEPIAQAPTQTQEPTPEPEPQPIVADTAAGQPAEPTDESTEQDTTTSTAVDVETTNVAATPTPIASTFATPTPIAQVQGEAGIALQPFVSGVSRQASEMAHLLSQPEFLFRTLMLTLFALIALSLLISVGVEAKRHHVPQALKALGALAVLLLVFYFGTNFIFKDPMVAEQNQSDNRLSAEMPVSGSMLES